MKARATDTHFSPEAGQNTSGKVAAKSNPRAPKKVGLSIKRADFLIFS
nr:hypothetical protein [Ruficoccus amylovorans]